MDWPNDELNIDYVTRDEINNDSGFIENITAAYVAEESENLMNSESIVMMEDVNNAYEALYEHTGQLRFDILSNYSYNSFNVDFRDISKHDDLIQSLRQQHPDDTRLRQYQQMVIDKKPELKAIREHAQSVSDRAGFGGMVGGFLGTMAAHTQDPAFMYSLPFGATGTIGKSAVIRTAQFAAKEMGIAGAAEVPVTVSRYDWKQQIDSPWTVWDAAQETLLIMAGTGILSGAGYAIGDALGWTNAAKAAKEAGLEEEARILQRRADIINESEAQGVPVEELLDARQAAENQMFSYTTTWHGSPHEWESPDLSKMGSGEGAQAFGWGFYTAEARGVAEGYQKELGSKIVINNTTIYEKGKITGSTGNAELDDYLVANLGDVDKARQDVKSAMAEVSKSDPDGAQDYKFLLDRLDKIEAETTNTGHLYKLQISDETINKMLDWDKPLTEQSESVRDAIQPVIDKVWQYKKGASLWQGKSKKEFIGSELQTGDDLYSYLEVTTNAPQGMVKRFDNRDEAVEFFRAEKQRFNDAPMSSGKGTYEPVAKLDGDNFTVETYDQFGKTHGQQAASEYLNSLGIPGIKYLDGDSRASGDGTRNYVVFDEKNITTLERDGVALADTESGLESGLEPGLEPGLESPSKYRTDLEVPGEPISDGNEIQGTVRSYAEVMEEFDAEERIWNDFEVCIMGLSDGE